MIQNGIELQAMTFNGQEVNTWFHNDVEVYSGATYIIKNGQLSNEWELVPIGTSKYATEVHQQDANVRFYHYNDGGTAYVIIKPIVDLSKLSRLIFKVDSAYGAAWNLLYSVGVCTGDNKSYPTGILKTASIIEANSKEYKIDLSSFSENSYVFIGMANITGYLDISEMYFE